MGDDHDTGSDRVTYPTGDLPKLEYGWFQKSIHFVSRSWRFFC
jgi:hypothetical protein